MNNDLQDDSTILKKPIIYGSGLVALDIIYKRNGSTLEQFSTAAGGSCGNILTILSYLGWNTYPLARLGKGPLVEIMLEDLEKWNVKTDFLVRTDSNSIPVVIEKINLNKNPPTHSFSFRCPTCGDYLPRFQPITLKQYSDLLPKIKTIPDVFYFDRIAPSILKMAEKFAGEGTLIIFEPQVVKDTKKMRKAIELSNVLKYSNQRNDTNLVIEDIIELKSLPDLEIVTLGADGLKYRRKDSNWQFVKSFPIANIHDTAGAGDWCTAGIINQLARKGLAGIQNLDKNLIDNALKFGQALSAINCSFYGARGSMYNIEVDKLISYVLQIIENNEDTFFILPKNVYQSSVEDLDETYDSITKTRDICEFFN